MLSHLMETLLLVLIASSRNVESSTGTVAGNNGKRKILRWRRESFPLVDEKTRDKVASRN